jgi:hypothetical protein
MICSKFSGEVGGPSSTWLSILMVLWLITLVLVVFWDHSRRRRPLVVLFLFVSAAATLTGYDVRHTVDMATGIPDGSILAVHLLAMLGVVTMMEAATALTDRGDAGDAVRRRPSAGQALVVVDMICMAALFAVIPRRLDHPDFGCWQARSLIVVTYQLLYQAALGTGLVVAIATFRPHTRTAGKRLLRNALRLLTAGFVMGLAYVVVRCWFVVAHGLSLPYLLEGTPYPAVILEISLVLVSLGVLIPVVYRTGLFLRRLVRYHRLRPVWVLLDQAAPGHVLGVVRAPLADLVALRGIERRLYRRAIEIRDAQWELAGFVSQPMAESAIAALRDAQPPPVGDVGLGLEALGLEVACRAKLAGLPCVNSQDSASWSGDADLDSETRGLLALQRLREDPWTQATAESIVHGESVRSGLS